MSNIKDLIMEWADSGEKDYERFIAKRNKMSERFGPIPQDGRVRYLNQVHPLMAYWLKDNDFWPTSPWRATKYTYDHEEEYECTVVSIRLERRDGRHKLVAYQTGEGEAPEFLPDAATCAEITAKADALWTDGKFPAECTVERARLRDTLPEELK